MAEPKARIVLRFFAVVIACLYFALLVTGHFPQQQLPQLILPSAMMVVFLVFGLFGLKRAEALLGIFLPVQRKPPVAAEQPGSGPLEMNAAPASMGNAKVIAFTAIDHRHQPTGACRHIVAGELQGPAAGLAICKYEADPGYHLLYCDQGWNPITDSYHETVEAAKQQAECEYEGVSGTWQHLEESR